MDKEQMTESTNGEKTIPHLHQMIGFCLSWGLTYAWTAKKKKGKVTHQFKKKRNDNNKLQNERRKEALPFSLSLQGLQASFAYYGYAQRVPKNHGPKYSQELGKKKTLP